jgi:hypothetical protein
MITLLLLLLVISPLILLIRAEYKDGISSVKTEEKKKKTKKNREFHQTRYDSYDSYDTKEKEKKFEKIFNLLIKDFNNSPYEDKFITKNISDGIYFLYTFNNGYRVSMYNEYLLLSKANGEELNSFALDSVQTIQMYRLINEIIDKAVNRNHRTYNEYDYQKKYNEYRQEQTKPKAEPKPETTGNPKLDKILEKIKLRKEQLTKMKSNDPERAALLNELKTYENVANKMKSKVK